MVSRWQNNDRGGTLNQWVGLSVFIIILVAVIVLLTGCSKAPSHGVVHDRSYTAAQDVYTPHCVSYRKDGTCAITMPHYTHYDASCRLDIYLTKDDHGWVAIPCSEYQKYNVGSRYGESGSF